MELCRMIAHSLDIVTERGIYIYINMPDIFLFFETLFVKLRAGFEEI